MGLAKWLEMNGQTDVMSPQARAEYKKATGEDSSGGSSPKETTSPKESKQGIVNKKQEEAYLKKRKEEKPVPKGTKQYEKSHGVYGD